MSNHTTVYINDLPEALQLRVQNKFWQHFSKVGAIVILGPSNKKVRGPALPPVPTPMPTITIFTQFEVDITIRC